MSKKNRIIFYKDFKYCFFTRNGGVSKKNFSSLKPLVCFAVKSNSNLQLIKEIKKLGMGADVVSKGEMIQALKAGISTKKIVQVAQVSQICSVFSRRFTLSHPSLQKYSFGTCRGKLFEAFW